MLRKAIYGIESVLNLFRTLAEAAFSGMSTLADKASVTTIFGFVASAALMRPTQGGAARRAYVRTRIDIDESPACPTPTFPAPHNSDSDWSIGRVADVVRGSIARAERSVSLHAKAGEKLDAAEYGLRRMLDELSSVMTNPLQPMEALPLDARPARQHAPALRLAA